MGQRRGASHFAKARHMPGKDKLRKKAEPPAAPPLIRSEDLFRGLQEVLIEHAGVRYRLRITRRDKLILQK